MRSEWKMVGGIYGMLYLSAKHSRSLVWWDNSRRKSFWRTIQKTDHSIWFTGWVVPFYCEGPVKNPSIWKGGSLTWILPWICIVRGWKLAGWRIGCRPWGIGDDGRIGNPLKKTQCERGDITQRKWKIFSQSHTSWKRSRLRTSTLIREKSIRGEGRTDFLGQSEGSLPPPQDLFPDAADFWSMSGNFIYRHHVEPRIKHYSPREESVPIPLKYIDPELLIRIWMSSKDYSAQRFWKWANSMECFFYLRIVQDFFVGRHHLNGASEYHSTGQQYCLDGRKPHHFCEKLVKNASFSSKTTAFHLKEYWCIRQNAERRANCRCAYMRRRHECLDAESHREWRCTDEEHGPWHRSPGQTASHHQTRSWQQRMQGRDCRLQQVWGRVSGSCGHVETCHLWAHWAWRRSVSRLIEETQVLLYETTGHTKGLRVLWCERSLNGLCCAVCSSHSVVHLLFPTAWVTSMLTSHHLKSFSVPLSTCPFTPAVTSSRVSTIHQHHNDVDKH